jgi:hypothetical protein
LIPFRIINLDKPRKIKFGYKALITAQVLTGKAVLDVVMDTTRIDVDILSKLLYAGLQHEDKDLTLEKVIDLVDEYAENVTDVIDATTEAFCDAVGVKLHKVEDDNPNAQSPTEKTENAGT